MYENVLCQFWLFITLVPKVLYKSFLILGTLMDFDWLVHKVQTFQQLIVIQRRGDLMFYNWGGTSIYRPLVSPLNPWEINCLYLCL